MRFLIAALVAAVAGVSAGDAYGDVVLNYANFAASGAGAQTMLGTVEAGGRDLRVPFTMGWRPGHGIRVRGAAVATPLLTSPTRCELDSLSSCKLGDSETGQYKLGYDEILMKVLANRAVAKGKLVIEFLDGDAVVYRMPLPGIGLLQLPSTVRVPVQSKTTRSGPSSSSESRGSCRERTRATS